MLYLAGEYDMDTRELEEMIVTEANQCHMTYKRMKCCIFASV